MSIVLLKYIRIMETVVEIVGDSLAVCSLVFMAALAVGAWLLKGKKDVEEAK